MKGRGFRITTFDGQESKKDAEKLREAARQLLEKADRLDEQAKVQAWFHDLYNSRSYQNLTRALRVHSGRSDDAFMRNIKLTLRNGCVWAYIERLRSSGETYKSAYEAAAKDFNLSPSRVKSIYLKQKRIMKRPEID